jgi:hypothetical protein
MSACCSDKPGAPGSFDRLYEENLQEETAKQSEGLHASLLHDGSSLVSQLCPGLRLCLAAEVATGLMCDR